MSQHRTVTSMILILKIEKLLVAFKTSCKTKNCYAADVLKSLYDMFAGKITIHESGFDLFIIKIRCYQFDKIQAVS